MGTVPWTPALIDTDLWLDAADSSTITIATGVSEWRDKSGKGNHVTQATPASQPTVQGNGIKFDGSDDSLGKSPSPFITFPLTTFSIVTPLASGKGVVYKTADGGGVAVGCGSNTMDSSGPNFLGLKEGTAWINGGAFSIPDLWQAVWTASGGGSSLLRSGTVVATSDAAYAATSGMLYVGGYLAPGNRIFNGTIHENIFIKEILALADREIIEGYLAWKWGLEANLPAAHPYKSAAPLVFEAEINIGYAVDTSLTAKDMLLPLNPKAGNRVSFADYAGTFGTNNLIVYPNGSPIAGLNSSLVLNQNGRSVELTFFDDAVGWAITG